MKKLALIAALLLPVAAWAQEFGARTSIGADYKIQNGLHLGVEEELRVEDGTLDNLRTTLDLSYKVNKYLKVGGGYTLINPWKVSDELTGFNNPRHRLFVSATGHYKIGDFQLSLKEKLQFTHRTGDSLNVYQTNPNALALKSRIGVKYKGFADWEPFAYFELRTALNDPWGEVSGNLQYTNKDRAYYTYTHTGYTHVYNNRYRFNIGTDWAPSKKHNFTFGILADYCTDYEIDTNGPSNWEEKGVRLFTETTGWVDTFRLSVCIGYQFKF